MLSAVLLSPLRMAAAATQLCHQRAALLLLASAASGAAQPSGQPLPTDAYFDEYGTLFDHIGMLQDHERMSAYHDAILLNAERHFKDKVILDVGTGTGVLSIWAAKAGAKKVYAIEATTVSEHAKKMAAAHGFGETITVLRGRMEEIELPEKVDVLLSEWMGYFLLRESMVSSVLLARDRWLKPSGVMYPSSARLLMASLEEPGFVDARKADVQETMANWDVLGHDLAARYGLDMESLRDAYEAENTEYSMRQAWQGALGANARVGEGQILLDVDMRTVTDADLFGWTRAVAIPEASKTAEVSTLVGWFDVRFCADAEGEEGGSRAESGDPSCVELTTSPTAPYTHWAHTTFVMDPPLTSPGLTVGLTQIARNHHDLNVTLSYDGVDSASYAVTAEFRTAKRSAYDYPGSEDEPGYDEAYGYDEEAPQPQESEAGEAAA